MGCVDLCRVGYPFMKTESTTPSANDMRVGFYTELGGTHVVCLLKAQDVEVLRVQGQRPDNNWVPRIIKSMKSARGYPEHLQPLGSNGVGRETAR